MNKRKNELIHSILWLESLLDNNIQKELTYQTYFELNSIVFDILGFDEFYPLTKKNSMTLPKDEYSDLQPEPDFITKNKNGIYEIFEIKTPTNKSITLTRNKYREQFTSFMSSYISQTLTYDNYFNNPSNREKTNNLLGTNIQETLPITIIVGLNEYIDKETTYKLVNQYKSKITVLTYDDVLEKLKQYYKANYGEYEGLNGHSIHIVVKLGERQRNKIGYIVDVTEEHIIDKNRASIYVDKNSDLCFRIIDNTSKSFIVKVDANEFDYFNNFFYLECEFIHTKDGFVMTIYINGSEYQRFIKNTPINLNLTGRMILGNDITKQKGSICSIAKYEVFDKSLDYYTRYITFIEKNEEFNFIELQPIPE